MHHDKYNSQTELENGGIVIPKHNDHPSPMTLHHIPQTLNPCKNFTHHFQFLLTSSAIQEINCREYAEQFTFFVKHRTCYSEVFTSVSVFCDIHQCEASDSFSKVRRTKDDDSWPTWLLGTKRCQEALTNNTTSHPWRPQLLRFKDNLQRYTAHISGKKYFQELKGLLTGQMSAFWDSRNFFFNLCLLVTTRASPSRCTAGYLQRLYNWSQLPIYL